MKSFERGFRRSAFETCFEGVELQGKGPQRQPKIRQLFYARISIHGLQGSRQNGEFGQLCRSVRQYRDRTTRVDPMPALRVNSGTASDAERDTRQMRFTPEPHIRTSGVERSASDGRLSSREGKKGQFSPSLVRAPRVAFRKSTKPPPMGGVMALPRQPVAEGLCRG
jgi:hypothetical protein